MAEVAESQAGGAAAGKSHGQAQSRAGSRASGRTMIHVDGLTKNYGLVKAVAGISFDVHAGEILGFLGPNGAGKTTTMKIPRRIFRRPQAEPKWPATTSQSSRWRRGAHRLLARRHAALQRHDGAGVPKLRIGRPWAAAGRWRTRRLRQVVEQCGLGDRLGFLIGELSKGLNSALA